MLALGCCYGFAAYIGLIFSPLMSILPFIMLGVGVDGMFVLQNALDATDVNDPMELRMGQAMQHGGLSVTVASLTNFGAFMIGSNTSLPVLAAFSIYAALAILFDLLLQVRYEISNIFVLLIFVEMTWSIIVILFVLNFTEQHFLSKFRNFSINQTVAAVQITFFSAIMCLDQRRVERRAADIFPCITTTSPEDCGYCCGLFGKPSNPEGYRMRAMRWVGTQYTKLTVKIAVIVVWLGLLSTGIYGTSQMRVESDINDFIPAGSYLKDWLATVETHFPTTGTTCYLYWVNDEPVRTESF